ncbi:MAG TPA: HDOD domain-containing protein [Leptospiraceae bacterium]|nr:HDOD domain-containing protein [Leptospiraceae bacterium]HNI95126.1 HDOD domain-containing protein [Leptospiraceae bacterium]HNN04619.1 HDOD domain-containing protein [Leptospiraceae bacterium]HNO22033.1 HDOD domain-containing protein [Leptospiraceae bacterium]
MNGLTGTEAGKREISLSEPLCIKWKILSDPEFMEISSILQTLLNQWDKLYLAETIMIILRELLINANRAIVKREFFLQRNYNLNSHYDKGMYEFREYILKNWPNNARTIMEDSLYFVSLKISLNEDGMIFEIMDNCSLHPVEKSRIQSRIQAADKYRNIMEAYKDISDSQESAGLGIIMILKLLNGVGLDSSHFELHEGKEETKFVISFPSEIIPLEISTKMQERIIKEVEILPSLPQALTKIMDICRSPNMDMKKLVDEIEKNPAVSADVLKLANSAGFISRAKPNNLSLAVRKIGSNGVLKMLYAISSLKILNGRYGKMEAEWDHAGRTSFFAGKLAKDFNYAKLLDSVVVGSLLHDIGKILLLSVDSELMSEILLLTKNRATENTKVLEESTIGVSHSKLGAMLAKKWNFPEDLSACIEFHQQPYMAPEEYRTHAEIVYLANLMANKVAGEIYYYSLEEEILNKYGIDSKDKFDRLVKEYEKAYKSEIPILKD